jgi:hypothetical protein
VSENEQFTREELKAAFKAFKKRMKVLRVDDESGWSRSPMTGGRRSGIAAIKPPHQYPREIWEELVEQGKLKYAGSGLYELP